MTEQLTRATVIELYKLTEAEVRYVEALAYGWFPHTEIAARVGWSVSHVKDLHQRVRTKTKITNRDLLAKLGHWIKFDQKPLMTDLGDSWKCVDLPDGCGQMRPIEMFPTLPIDPRCQDCIDYHTGQARDADRRRKTKLAVAGLMRSVGAARIDLPHVNDCLAELMDKEGGYKRFVAEWSRMLQEARQKSPGAKYVLDAHRDIVRTIAAANELTARNADLEKMDDDETREFLANLVLEHLAKSGQEKLLDVFAEEEEEEERQENDHIVREGWDGHTEQAS